MAVAIRASAPFMERYSQVLWLRTATIPVCRSQPLLKRWGYYWRNRTIVKSLRHPGLGTGRVL
jgi:hypothetical protein